MLPALSDLTIVFDENIIKIELKSDSLEWSTSGETVATAGIDGNDYEFTVTLMSGYTIDTVTMSNSVEEGGGVLKSQGNASFIITAGYGGLCGTYTITSKLAETEDPLAGTWVFNGTAKKIPQRVVDGLTYNAKGTCGSGEAFNFLDFNTDMTYMAIAGSSWWDISTNIYGSDTASNMITITSKLSEVTAGDTLLTWLQSNATKQADHATDSLPTKIEKLLAYGKAQLGEKGVDSTATTVRGVLDDISSIETDKGLTINGVIEQYKVAAGANVSAGDFVKFIEEGFGRKTAFDIGVHHIYAVALNDTKVLLSYRKNSKPTVVALTIDGMNIIVGTQVSFADNASDSLVSLTVLSETKVLAVYQSGSAVVLTVNGIDITVGTITAYDSNTFYNSAVALTDTKVLVAYCVNTTTSWYGKAVILTISGNSIGVGTKTTFYDGSPSDISVTSLSSDKVLLTYVDDSDYGTVALLTINGTIISLSTTQIFSEAKTLSPSVLALSDTKALLTYIDYNSRHGVAMLSTINSATITLGISMEFTDSGISDISTMALSDTEVLIAYSDGGNSSYGTSVILTISDDAITVNDRFVFNYSITSYISLVLLNSGKIFVAYNDYRSGNAIIMGLAVDGVNITSGTYDAIQPAIDRSNYVGIANMSGTEGENVDVYCAPIISYTVTWSGNISSVTYNGMNLISGDSVPPGAEITISWGSWFSGYITTSGLYINDVEVAGESSDIQDYVYIVDGDTIISAPYV